MHMNWINVRTKLPKLNTFVLCRFTHHQMSITYACRHKGIFRFVECASTCKKRLEKHEINRRHFYFSDVTHWVPIEDLIIDVEDQGIVVSKKVVKTKYPCRFCGAPLSTGKEAFYNGKSVYKSICSECFQIADKGLNTTSAVKIQEAYVMAMKRELK